MYSITIHSDDPRDILKVAEKVKDMDVKRSQRTKDRFYGTVSISLGNTVMDRYGGLLESLCREGEHPIRYLGGRILWEDLYAIYRQEAK